MKNITTDDHLLQNLNAGHLFAATYVTTLDEDTANDVVRAYVWKNGIDQKPTPFIYSDVKGGMYANAPYGVNGVKTIEMFNTVRVHGDLTKDAVIATSSWKNLRPVFQFVKDGALQSKAYVYWPSSGATPSLGAMTTVIPFSFPNDLNALTWQLCTMASILLHPREDSSSTSQECMWQIWEQLLV